MRGSGATLECAGPGSAWADGGLGEGRTLQGTFQGFTKNMVQKKASLSMTLQRHLLNAKKHPYPQSRAGNKTLGLGVRALSGDTDEYS